MSGRPPLSPFFLYAAVFALADQMFKWAVSASFTLGESVIIVPGLLNLTYVRNRGGAFGLLAWAPSVWTRTFFVAATLAALVFVFYLYRYSPPAGRWGRFALVLIFGGGLGNLVDRVAYGEVIDFVVVYYRNFHWPAFNLADSGISVGVVLLALDLLRKSGR